MTTPTNWHHLWVGDNRHTAAWRKPAEEHFDALRASGFDGDVVVGLVGGPKQRAEARTWLNVACPTWILGVVAEDGFEMVTINVMQQWCQRGDVSDKNPVLYTHGKGSFQSSAYADAWRRNMTSKLVGDWRDCVKSLHTVDAVGCHWLTHEKYPDQISPTRPMFGGNFWWANAGFVAALPPIGWSNRWEAEGWMGQGNPTVVNLVEGWPVY